MGSLVHGSCFGACCLGWLLGGWGIIHKGHPFLQEAPASDPKLSHLVCELEGTCTVQRGYQCVRKKKQERENKGGITPKGHPFPQEDPASDPNLSHPVCELEGTYTVELWHHSPSPRGPCAKSPSVTSILFNGRDLCCRDGASSTRATHISERVLYQIPDCCI